jgi:hypothetical protein
MTGYLIYPVYLLLNPIKHAARVHDPIATVVVRSRPPHQPHAQLLRQLPRPRNTHTYIASPQRCISFRQLANRIIASNCLTGANLDSCTRGWVRGSCATLGEQLASGRWECSSFEKSGLQAALSLFQQCQHNEQQNSPCASRLPQGQSGMSENFAIKRQQTASTDQSHNWLSVQKVEKICVVADRIDESIRKWRYWHFF